VVGVYCVWIPHSEEQTVDTKPQLTEQPMDREYLRRRDAMVLAVAWFQRTDINTNETLEDIARLILKFTSPPYA
jgi:hypothetical protein